MQFSRDATLTKRLKCVFVHQNDKFLQIGPFKLEFLHQDPEIALVHDFASAKETDNIIHVARGKTKSTPLYENGAENDFTKKRTSKGKNSSKKYEPLGLIATFHFTKFL